MRNIQNKSLKYTPLNVRGTVYTGDADGIFAMQPEHANLIINTPGWIATMMPYLPDAEAARAYWALGIPGQPIVRSEAYMQRIRLRESESEPYPWIELRVQEATRVYNERHVIPCTIYGNEIQSARSSYIHSKDVLGYRRNNRPKEKRHCIMRLRPWIADDSWAHEIQALCRFRRGIDEPGRVGP